MSLIFSAVRSYLSASPFGGSPPIDAHLGQAGAPDASFFERINGLSRIMKALALIEGYTFHVRAANVLKLEHK